MVNGSGSEGSCDRAESDDGGEEDGHTGREDSSLSSPLLGRGLQVWLAVVVNVTRSSSALFFVCSRIND